MYIYIEGIIQGSNTGVIKGYARLQYYSPHRQLFVEEDPFWLPILAIMLIYLDPVRIH